MLQTGSKTFESSLALTLYGLCLDFLLALSCIVLIDNLVSSKFRTIMLTHAYHQFCAAEWGTPGIILFCTDFIFSVS